MGITTCRGDSSGSRVVVASEGAAGQSVDITTNRGDSSDHMKVYEGIYEVYADISGKSPPLPLSLPRSPPLSVSLLSLPLRFPLFPSLLLSLSPRLRTFPRSLSLAPLVTSGSLPLWSCPI